MNTRMDAVIRNDDEDDTKGSKPLATSLVAIKSCKAGLKKKLA